MKEKNKEIESIKEECAQKGINEIKNNKSKENIFEADIKNVKEENLKKENQNKNLEDIKNLNEKVIEKEKAKIESDKKENKIDIQIQTSLTRNKKPLVEKLDCKDDINKSNKNSENNSELNEKEPKKEEIKKKNNNNFIVGDIYINYCDINKDIISNFINQSRKIE